MPNQSPNQSSTILALYLAALALLSFHLYRTPIYDMDSLQYMGNALLMQERDPVQIHHRVYAELRRAVPKETFDHLTGIEPGAPPDHRSNGSSIPWSCPLQSLAVSRCLRGE